MSATRVLPRLLRSVPTGPARPLLSSSLRSTPRLSLPTTPALRSFSIAPSRLSPVAQIQQPAPAWKATAVVDGEFKELSSEDFKGKYLVLFFYPLDFTFVCPTEIIAFSERAEEFRALGCEVVGCSVDSEHSHLAWINTPRNKGGLGGMKIPLLSDITKSIASSYGVLLPAGIALRGTFIIGPDGMLRVTLVNDLPVGRSIDEVLRLVEAVQFTDRNGEVCPAGWEKGKPTMKADPVKSKEYFSATYGN
ncbi:thioredoxin-like protein [Gonapodya prolifera JEL478]|uniref:thioredoxin-dependent peroxiredoxin n=1 Tax=Gonapodya prolifera (strain JEL478) TaxID=1344416 RepID=A0A139AH24_GONPJ|nr:thioredoxin-like protein [Gonapodya prolifera JEL478]|eukprot:KXS15864.1 thioredoxin-like protein [Gonapodya prolifera JEL478]